MNSNCPGCNKAVTPNDAFCSHCGTKLIEQSTNLSVWQLIKIYAVTILLAPFGLYWFFKYFKNSDPKKRGVAYSVLVITIVIILLVITSSAYIIDFYRDFVETNIPDPSLYDF